MQSLADEEIPTNYAGMQSAKLYTCPLQAPTGETTDKVALALLNRFDEKRHDRWTEAVNTINFMHLKLEWNTLCNLTGRNKRLSHPCPISTNSIASQLLKNGVYSASARLLNNEITDLWKRNHQRFQHGEICLCLPTSHFWKNSVS